MTKKKSFDKRLKKYRSMSLEHQIDNIIKLGKKVDKQLYKVIKQLDKISRKS